MATSETVQLPTSNCDSMSTNADELLSQPPPTVCKPHSVTPHVVDHTYSIIHSGTTKVTLLSSNGNSVGVGSIVGDVLHGKAIPPGDTKVVIEYIQPGTLPMLNTNFDEEELCPGQFTAWATACILYKLNLCTHKLDHSTCS